MTASHHSKILNQIKGKPGKVAKYRKYNVPKEKHERKNRLRCEVSGSRRGVIHKYSINLSRHKFREVAEELGFKKYS